MSTYVEFPTGPLAGFVDLIWVSEEYAAPHAQERLMPGGAMAVVITWNRQGDLWSGVSGVHTQSALLDTSRPFNAAGVSFKAGGGFPFFPMPAGELHNLVVPLDAVWGRRADAVCEQLMATPTPAGKARVLECALLAAARRRFDRHRAVTYAVSQLSRQRAVASIVDDVGLSQRRFIELFRNEVGVTPKAFSRVRRFQHVLGAIEDMQDVDWSEVALSAGYFDQAHFIHDFRDFAGVSPSTYLTHRRSRNHVAIP